MAAPLTGDRISGSALMQQATAFEAPDQIEERRGTLTGGKTHQEVVQTGPFLLGERQIRFGNEAPQRTDALVRRSHGVFGDGRH